VMACHFCFNFLDSIWVGRLIGPAALAAVSTSGFYVWVALSLGEMVEIGLIAVAARRHGEGDPERAARAAAAAVVYAVCAGLVVSAAGERLADPMFRLMSVPPEVAKLGHAYLSTWLLGGPLVFGFFAIEATFRAAGDTRTPFALLAASVLLSIGLDPLLIAGVGPFPRLGVEGAAVASVMVRGGGFLIGVGIALKRGLIRLDAPDWRAVPTLLRVGAPLSLAGVLLSVVYMWLTRYTARFGTAALAALGVGHKVEGIGFLAISGFALSAAALVGQNLGAHQEARARQAVRITVLTDFGTADSYGGEVKGVLLSQVPGVVLADITHQVAPGDVRAAQYILSRVWQRFPQGTVHLAVVDPGVGTSRRALAAQTAGHFFVAPDNGLLSFLP